MTLSGTSGMWVFSSKLASTATSRQVKATGVRISTCTDRYVCALLLGKTKSYFGKEGLYARRNEAIRRMLSRQKSTLAGKPVNEKPWQQLQGGGLVPDFDHKKKHGVSVAAQCAQVFLPIFNEVCERMDVVMDAFGAGKNPVLHRRFNSLQDLHDLIHSVTHNVGNEEE